MSETQQYPEPEWDITFAVGPAQPNALRDAIIRSFGIPARLVSSPDGVTYLATLVQCQHFFGKEP